MTNVEVMRGVLDLYVKSVDVLNLYRLKSLQELLRILYFAYLNAQCLVSWEVRS